MTHVFEGFAKSNAIAQVLYSNLGQTTISCLVTHDFGGFAKSNAMPQFLYLIWVQSAIYCLGMRRYQCGIVTREFLEVLLRIIFRNASLPIWNYN